MYYLFVTVRSFGLTRDDPDGIEHLVLAFFILASTITFLFYPLVAFFFSNEDVKLYNHLLYFVQTLLPSSAALIVGWAVTGIILNIVVGISFLYIFVIATLMTLYVVTQTLWMINIRKLW